MTISSRTPEGVPSHCPLCGAATKLEFSDPAGDAPCPNCGQLVWHSAQLLGRLQTLLLEHEGAAETQQLTPDTRLSDIRTDSLDVVELLMEFEDEFGVPIPDDDYERLRTIGDVVRYTAERQGRPGD